MIGALAQMGARRRSGVSAVPVNSVAPAVTGTFEIGQVLSCSTGTWSGSPSSYTYQWQRDGVDIGGATASMHTVVSADIGPGTGGTGTGLRCLVTATNGAGSGTPAVSNAVVFDHASYLPDTAIVISTAGVSVSGGVVDSWTATLGGLAAALASSGGARPAYNATGGVGSRPLITSDGVDDILQSAVTKGSAWSNYEIGIVGQRLSFTAANEGIAGYGSGGAARFYMNDNSSTTWRFTVVGGANVTGGNPGTAPAHISGDAASGGTINTRTAGTVVNTGSATVTSRADGESWCLFSRTPAGADYANYAVQAAYIGPLLTADQRTHLRALLTYHTGISC